MLTTNRAEMSSVTTNYEAEIHVAIKQPCNTNRNEHAGKEQKYVQASEYATAPGCSQLIRKSKNEEGGKQNEERKNTKTGSRQILIFDPFVISAGTNLEETNYKNMKNTLQLN